MMEAFRGCPGVLSVDRSTEECTNLGAEAGPVGNRQSELPPSRTGGPVLLAVGTGTMGAMLVSSMQDCRHCHGE